MPRINLLPWRAELRARRRNQFFIGLGGAVLAAALVIGLASLVMGAIVDNQQARNELLNGEIQALDKRIEEILDLEARKDRLLARMEIIEQLQRSRPGIVHVFDQLVRTLPDGVNLSAIKQKGDSIEIKGQAESNTRVSAFMRNIDKSSWLKEPDLEVVEVKSTGKQGDMTAPRASEFTVVAKQVVSREAGEAQP
ncbi:MAG: PilN domain-containing protein [Gammaproteobacteria bacterium]|nr:PilN domain-containing protein [Gammaproteobacteria bacterium]